MQKVNFFVIIPSGKHGEYINGLEEAEFIYDGIIKESIKSAVEEIFQPDKVELTIEREIDDLSSGAINKNIVTKTADADYVIVDITGTNPNVFFELGLRYAFKPSGTILIRQKNAYIPFDVNTYRSIEYDSKFFGVKKAINQLKEAIIKKINRNQVDSLVYDTFPNLFLDFDKSLLQAATNEKVMPWNYFWEKFNTYIEMLKGSRYKPNYIIGISNGGLFLADTVSRLLFPEIPIISFWANRTHHKREIFSNEINNCLIKVIGENGKKKKSLLIFDDIVATGETWFKLKDFLHNNLENYSVLFIPLFSKNRRYLQNIKADTPWAKTIFQKFLPKSDFEEFCYTNYENLPYSKEINFNK